MNVYAPNAHQLCFFNKLLKTIHKHQQGGLLLCGNFNITPDPAIDYSSYNGRYATSLQCFIQSHDLFDAWRCFHASERDFTFFLNLTALIVEYS